MLFLFVGIVCLQAQSQYSMPAFRGYFEAFAEETPAEPDVNPAETIDVNPDVPAGARMNGPARHGSYRTLFQNTDQQGTSSGEDVSFDNLRFEGVIPYIKDTPTGIQPTIVAVEADGTCHYFNLQGQQLKDKPQKGIYISNGIKHISK